MGTLRRFTNLLAHVSDDIPVVKTATDRDADRRAAIEKIGRGAPRVNRPSPPLADR